MLQIFGWIFVNIALATCVCVFLLPRLPESSPKKTRFIRSRHDTRYWQSDYPGKSHAFIVLLLLCFVLTDLMSQKKTHTSQECWKDLEYEYIPVIKRTILGSSVVRGSWMFPCFSAAEKTVMF